MKRNFDAIGDCVIITDKRHDLLQKAGNYLIAE